MEDIAKEFRIYQANVRQELMKLRMALKPTTLAYLAREGTYYDYEEWVIAGVTFDIQEIEGGVANIKDIAFYDANHASELEEAYNGYVIIRGNIGFTFDWVERTINVFFYIPKEDIDASLAFSPELIPADIPLIDSSIIESALTKDHYAAIDEIIIDIAKYMVANEQDIDPISLARTVATVFNHIEPKLAIEEVLFASRDISSVLQYIDANPSFMIISKTYIEKSNNYYRVLIKNKTWQINLMTLLYVLERV